MHETMKEQDCMETNKALELIHDLRDLGTKAVTFSGGGEPLLHKDICKIMQATLDSNIDLSIITNGQLIKGERADILKQAKWVRVSMDYTDAMQMQESRNTPARFFDSVMENLSEFAKSKPASCDLGINFIITRDNYQNIVPFAKRLKEVGVENVRFSPVYVNNFISYHAPIAERVVEQLLECQSFCDENFSINTTYDLTSPSKQNSHAFSRCLYAQAVCVVGADFNIYACHNTAYSSHGLIANMSNRSFKEAWFSEEARFWHANFKPCVSCTHECANHNKVVIFEKLATESHDNFI